jgi:CHRD domain
MTKIVSLVAGIVALAVVGAALARSTTTVYTFKSTMAPGAEVPKPKAPATAKGGFTATVTENGSVRTIRWTLTFRGLSGKAIAAHIHKGKAGVSGGVILALCGPCKSGQTGQAKISSAVADALERGLAYVNVHTGKNAGGEVRGQAKLLKRVEAPATEPMPAPATTTPDPGNPTKEPGYSY